MCGGSLSPAMRGAQGGGQVCGNAEVAFEHLRRAAARPDFNRDWARQDLDFHWLRADPRFEKIVGPADAAE